MTVLPLEEVFRRSVDVIERAGIPYFVFGGIALPAWGDVIQTRDVDLVVRLPDDDVGRLLGAFRSAGYEIEPDAERTMPIDKWTVAQWGGRDTDLTLATTVFDDEALRRAVRVRIFDRDVPIATAEDLILYKLVAFRFKDLGHVQDILDRQQDKLDRTYLRKWAREIADHTGKFEIPQTLEKMLAEAGLK